MSSKNIKLFFIFYLLFFNSLISFAVQVDEQYSEIIRELKNAYHNSEMINKTLTLEKISSCRPSKIEELDKSVECLLVGLKDPNTKFLSKDASQKEAKRIKENESQNYGIVLDPLNPLQIHQVLYNSPAQKKDIRSGDQIISINDIGVEYLTDEEIYALIEGQNVKEKVSLEINRANNYYFSVSLSAIPFERKAIKFKLLPENIQYIRIYDLLSTESPSIVKNILELSSVQNSDGLIIDLRGSSGGLLINGAKIANLFLPQGMMIVRFTPTRAESTVKLSNLQSSSQFLYKKPIVIWVDEKTASACELFTAALKENNRAYVIGSNTYGKASIQKVENLSNGNSIHITVAYFLTPKGNQIDQKGIQPNELVKDLDSLIYFSEKYIKNNK